MRTKSISHSLIHVLVNFSRFLLAFVFISSGFVKAIDPLGTSYKLTEYFEHFHLAGYLPEQFSLTLSIALSVVEFMLGIYIFFGIRRKFSCIFGLCFLAFMTFFTLYLAIKNPISDCGCFGDALILTNWETFGKNIILLACLIVVCYWRKNIFRIITESNQWLISLYSLFFIIAFSLYSVHYLPIMDFRPYRVGVNIKEAMTIPPNAPLPRYETVFIFEKNGQRKEFSINNYPDSTWTFVDSRTTVISKGYEPQIKDFYVYNPNGEDITTQILGESNYQFILISPHFSKADYGTVDMVNSIYDYCSDRGYKFFCITASTSSEIAEWRDRTGGNYPIYFADDVLLRTMIRSNPGLILLKEGTIIAKWSCNDLPDDSQLNGRLENLPITTVNSEKSTLKLLKALLFYLLPLLFLTLADRIWIGSRSHKKNGIKSLINKSKEK